MSHPIIRLKPKEDIRILSGHLWVFSNEISKIEGNPGGGDMVEVRNSKNSSIGFGYYNPKTLIAVRMVSKEFVEPEKDFFMDRLKSALSLRERYFDSPFYRLTYGESDFLPGLIIDRFNNLFSVQIFSIGMEKRKHFIYEAIKELFSPAAIYERNESQTRELEGLTQSKSIILGEEMTADYDEEGVIFRVNPLRGQKTGFYFDQGANRIFSRRFANHSRVLDLFSNEGGFALNMAHACASEVIAVDSSEPAINNLSVNARLNKLDQVKVVAADVNEYLTRVKDERFDVVICDPPNFTKNRKSIPSAKRGYRQLHESIFNTLRRGGILLTASCSHHIFRETFEEIVAEAALKSGRTLQLLCRAGASPDHPILPSMPETEYLKFNAYRVL
ncbi:MAG TPA: class I SAM-dependent rRNA methyltransferase [Candidatus Acidoferrales bacterium]|nr:class I SAM-dependent rRNA methyltransferase [Candidatus Acidoferrales bacterium]